MEIEKKLEILTGAAKYDVSCSSSGSSRKGIKGNLGNASVNGICHTYTPDGRCVSLLKILLTNYCIYDCAYCINRKSNDVERAAFTVDEVVELTMNFYRRNYIEGLFLSSAVFKNANHTMEMLMRVVKKLREEKGFMGYIHLKAIPGASQELIDIAGAYVDRMSVNIELPSDKSLKLLAPEKKKEDIFKPMKIIKSNININKEERSKYRNSSLYVPGGQSTQLIVGATGENDLNILNLTENLYKKYELKRVYYSAYIPVNSGGNLPSIASPPTLREHRLYQSDWLLRLYGFKANELLSESNPNFDINYDPKTYWAMENIKLFPIEINTASYEMLIRVPGIGIRGARKIMSARRIGALDYNDLKKLRITLKRAQYFILCKGKYYGSTDCDTDKIKKAIKPDIDLNEVDKSIEQLSFFTLDKGLFLPEKKLLLPDVTTGITGEL